MVFPVVFNILKEQIESKSQRNVYEDTQEISCF